MRVQLKLPLFLLVFAASCLMLSNHALAAATTIQDIRCGANSNYGVLMPGAPDATGTLGTEQQEIMDTHDARARAQGYAATIGQMSVKQLDAQADFCFDQITNLFSQVALLADPLNIIGTYINSQIATLVTAALNSVCAFAGSLTAAQTAILSNLNVCLPLPSFNLNFTPQFTIPTKPCNGTKVFGVQMTPVPATLQPSLYTIMFGTGKDGWTTNPQAGP